ncbi:hypothetical protein Syun_024920 [Stephania yunnanensis]|uniref:Uncharacterized protein n=1 Tax=Stephania yunnanensis TaxID=152371 RepID=A0AAP0HVR7_9MAGN
MAPKRKGREPVESAKKVGKARKARSSTGPSSEKPRAAASPTRRVTRRSNPVLVESPLEALPDIPRKKKARKTAQRRGNLSRRSLSNGAAEYLVTQYSGNHERFAFVLMPLLQLVFAVFYTAVLVNLCSAATCSISVL